MQRCNHTRPVPCGFNAVQWHYLVLQMLSSQFGFRILYQYCYIQFALFTVSTINVHTAFQTHFKLVFEPRKLKAQWEAVVSTLTH